MPSVRAYGDDATVLSSGLPDNSEFQCPRCGRTAMMRVFLQYVGADRLPVSMPSVRAYGDDARLPARDRSAPVHVSMPSVRAYGDDARSCRSQNCLNQKFQCPRCGRTAMMPCRTSSSRPRRTSFNALGAGVRR